MPNAALILMYHELGPEDRITDIEKSPYVLDPQTFAQHLQEIQASAHVAISVGDWAKERAERNRAERLIAQAPRLMITFDDGDASNHTHALPLLRECGLSATFFVTVGRIGNPGYLTWEQVLELNRAGMEIGSHTLTHRPPITLSASELRYELEESKRRLEDRLGAPVLSFSSPTGFFNPKVSDLAREAGFSAVCIGRIALVTDRDDLFALPRIPIKRSTQNAHFRLILRHSRPYLVTLRSRQMVRNGLKKLLGPDAYVRWRAAVLRRRTPR